MVKLNEEDKRHLEQEKASMPKEHAKPKDQKNKEAKEKAKSEAVIKTNATLEDLEVLWYPLVTEKAVGMIESENKITFVVKDTATKPEIKKKIEEAYGVKAIQINIIRDMKGRKKAIVKLDKKNKASELATKLGVL